MEMYMIKIEIVGELVKILSLKNLEDEMRFKKLLGLSTYESALVQMMNISQLCHIKPLLAI